VQNLHVSWHAIITMTHFHVESNATNNQHMHTPFKTCDFSF